MTSNDKTVLGPRVAGTQTQAIINLSAMAEAILLILQNDSNKNPFDIVATTPTTKKFLVERLQALGHKAYDQKVAAELSALQNCALISEAKPQGSVRLDQKGIVFSLTPVGIAYLSPAADPAPASQTLER